MQETVQKFNRYLNLTPTIVLRFLLAHKDFFTSIFFHNYDFDY